MINDAMINGDVIKYQQAQTAFRKTKLGELWYIYTSRQQRAERYDVLMESVGRGSESMLQTYWDEAKTAEENLLSELYKIEGMEYVR